MSTDVSVMQFLYRRVSQRFFKNFFQTAIEVFDCKLWSQFTFKKDKTKGRSSLNGKSLYLGEHMKYDKGNCKIEERAGTRK